MARILYLVTAHTNPGQVVRLVRALLEASPAGHVLLHWDAQAPALQVDEFAHETRLTVFPVRHAIRWGDFSLVETMLELLTWARQRLPFDWLVWISGQDYPLGALEGFESQLVNGKADAWMRHFPGFTHGGWPVGEGFRRYCFAYSAVPSIPRFYRFPASVRMAIDSGIKRFNTAQTLIQLRPRHRNNPAQVGLRARPLPFSAQLRCIAGWPWFNLNARSVAYLLSFVADHPAFVAHYRRTYCPDESFFHTILVNCADLVIENDPLRHVSWENRQFSSNPTVIARGPLLAAALASGKPFARKFDINVDAGCLDQLDTLIRARVTPVRAVEP